MQIPAVALVLLGAFLLLVGSEASESLTNSLSEMFRGTPEDRVMWFYIAGGVCLVAGLALLSRRSKGAKG